MNSGARQFYPASVTICVISGKLLNLISAYVIKVAHWNSYRDEKRYIDIDIYTTVRTYSKCYLYVSA